MIICFTFPVAANIKCQQTSVSAATVTPAGVVVSQQRGCCAGDIGQLIQPIRADENLLLTFELGCCWQAFATPLTP